MKPATVAGLFRHLRVPRCIMQRRSWLNTGRRPSRTHFRPLQVEPLEARNLLATLNLFTGELLIQERPGGSRDDVHIRYESGFLLVDEERVFLYYNNWVETSTSEAYLLGLARSVTIQCGQDD